MNAKNFYFFIISFFLGVFVYSFFEFSLINYFFIIIIFSSIFFINSFNNKKISKNFLLIFLALLGFFLGSIHYNYFNKNNIGDFNHLIHQKIEKKFIIVDEPEKKGSRTKLILQFQNSDSKALMWVQNYPERFYGDLIFVEGYLNYPENFLSSATERIFDYVSFLKKDSIFYEIKPLKITFIKKEQGSIIKNKLFKIKSSFLSQIKKLIPDPEASLLGGLLLGAKEDLGKDLLENFRKTGVIHIVVLSGYNLTIVADFFIKIFAFLGLTFSAFLGSISIILFAIMTGASPTIVRASLMALFVIFARATGKSSKAIRMLFLAGFLMLLSNPMLLAFNPSFQLSFLATFGLLILSPKIEEFLKFVPNKFLDFRGILAATLSTQIFVFPLILYLIGEISVVSPLVNILILILIPLVMFLGLIIVLFSYFSFFIASILAFVVYWILTYDLFLINFFAQFSFSVFQLKNFNFWFMILWYFLYLIIFLFWKYYKNKN